MKGPAFFAGLVNQVNAKGAKKNQAALCIKDD